MATKQKATRKITKFDFSGEDATVSLVGPIVGGSANGYQTLLTKSKRQLSEEFIKKASQVTVTLSINEYLEKFFGIWDKGNQELLARSLGFVTEGMDQYALKVQEDLVEMNEPPKVPNPWDVELGDKKLEDYVNYKLQSISVMKKLKDSDDIESVLGELSEEEYLQLIQDQELVEKAFSVYENNKYKQTKKETKDMAIPTVETVEKSLFVNLQKSYADVQKALDEKQVELTKALDTIKKFGDEKKQEIQKSRLAELQKAVGDEDKAAVIFEGCKESKDEVFNSIVKALAELNKNSSLFNEAGASSDESEVITDDPLTRLMKSKYGNK